MQSYRFMDSLDVYDEFVRNMLTWRWEGRLTLPEIIHEGLESAPEALCGIFSGRHAGKSLVRISS
jgi:NADPH-dependent curcumin reductase CurA